MRTIYVFEREDGTEWADYRVPVSAKVRRTVSASTEREWQAIVLAETGRVRALAERCLRELMDRKPAPVLAEIPRSVRERGFWQRLRWALFRK